MSNIPYTSAVYVTCHDKFMSGWGPATGKKNVLVILCHSHAEAEIVADNALNRGDMQYIKIHSLYPEKIINNDEYYVQFKSKIDMPNWFRAGAF